MPFDSIPYVDECVTITPEAFERMSERLRERGDVPIRMFVSPARNPSPTSPGNIFGEFKLRKDLDAVRAEVARAVLIAHGRRKLAPGESVPCLAALRAREAELIVRLDLVTGGRKEFRQ